MYKLFLVVLTASFLFYSNMVSAQELDSESKAWSVFSLMQAGAKICYITSSPTNQAGNYKRRGEPYLLVTYRGNGVSEVSASSGYPYKKNSTVSINLDNKARFGLFTTDETPKISWAKDVAEDKSIIANMIKGVNMKVKGNSRLGTYSEDTYSLLGFTKAYKRMQTLCKK